MVASLASVVPPPSPLWLAANRRRQALRVHRSRKKWVAATVAVAVFGTFAAAALGTGSLFFTTTPLATGNLDNPIQLNNDRIKLQTKDPTVVRVASVASVPLAAPAPAAGITTQAS